jgi:hypothetical protein
VSNVPAGWYPDTEQPGNERWWDGDLWTEARRPVITTPAAPATTGTTASPAAAKPLWKRTWLIVVAAVVALVVVGSVSGAIAGARKGDTALVALETTTPVASPTAVPSAEPSAAPSEEPVAATVDLAYFRATAGKQLDDYDKDLNDITDAAAKGSTLRVATNSVELALNSGQVAGIEAPTAIAGEWTLATASLVLLTSEISEAASKDDYTTIGTVVTEAHAQIAAMRDIVARAS